MSVFEEVMRALIAQPEIHNPQTCRDPGGFHPEKCTCHVRLRREAIARAEQELGRTFAVRTGGET